MRLRAIELTNVRRFAGQRARLFGIGDGITVLSEPNEFGNGSSVPRTQPVAMSVPSASRRLLPK